MEDKRLENLKNKIGKYYSKHIIFDLFRVKDLFFLHKAAKEEGFLNYLLWENTENIDDFCEKEKNFLDYTNNNNIVVSIFDIQNSEWIGLLKLIPYKDSYALSFWIQKKYWGKGFPLYSANYFIKLYFKYTENKTIYALTRDDYTIMKKICKYYGFKEKEQIKLKHENNNKIDFLEFKLEKKYFREIKGDRQLYELKNHLT